MYFVFIGIKNQFFFCVVYCKIGIFKNYLYVVWCIDGRGVGIKVEYRCFFLVIVEDVLFIEQLGVIVFLGGQVGGNFGYIVE